MDENLIVNRPELVTNFKSGDDKIDIFNVLPLPLHKWVHWILVHAICENESTYDWILESFETPHKSNLNKSDFNDLNQ